jgi:hypothetical protein
LLTHFLTHDIILPVMTLRNPTEHPIGSQT